MINELSLFMQLECVYALMGFKKTEIDSILNITIQNALMVYIKYDIFKSY